MPTKPHLRLSSEPVYHSYPSNLHTESLVRQVGDEYIELNPPYQRESVWTMKQKRLLIHSLINNFSIHDLTFSERHDRNRGTYFVVIDGKQRMEAICDFFNENLDVPRIWFHTDALKADAWGKEMVTFADLSDFGRRAINNLSLPTTICLFDSIEAEAASYVRLNSTGVAHTEDDLKKAQGE